LQIILDQLIFQTLHTYHTQTVHKTIKGMLTNKMTRRHNLRKITDNRQTVININNSSYYSNLKCAVFEVQLQYITWTKKAYWTAATVGQCAW